MSLKWEGENVNLDRVPANEYGEQRKEQKFLGLM